MANRKSGVHTLINGRCKVGFELVTQLRGTRRSGVARLRLGVAPNFQDGELLWLSDALEHFETAISRFLTTRVA